MTHLFIRGRKPCVEAMIEDGYTDGSLALLYVDCPRCIKKKTYKRLFEHYVVVSRNGKRVVKSLGV